ncbi:PREDICTED: uncharacterized protein LOC100635909 [Amphimedon queenslandica]|uniref:Cyclic nucleotide-binding domain-containing protein n=1 Tax=Amphimedon queenslandica TaxID=400682 RepID=A0A1X7UBN8_AMPQE|nr:PREDICTED: uncharacterized protein LOC100635909 [Amphimedon queenslandica]|eukprot:XP_003388419.1 PREDICTED: uncharacterized protein LOC100635909 [Amphimedon queenslandica]
MAALKPIIKKVQIHLQLGGSLNNGPAKAKELYDELTKLKPFLFHSNISTDALQSLSWDGVREAHEPKTVLWLQDECIDKFYILLRGSISVYLDPESDLSLSDTSAAASLAVAAATSGGSSSAKPLKTAASKKRLRGYGTEIDVIKPGQCFGELCCLSPSDLNKSPFTFVTNQYTEVLLVHKITFQQLLQDYFISSLIEKASFLISRYPMIHSWEIQYLSCLCSVIREKKYSLGEVVATQGSPVSCIYLVKEGLLKLSLNTDRVNLSEITSKIHPPMGLVAQILKLETKPNHSKKPKVVPRKRKEKRDYQGEKEAVLRRYRIKQPNLLRETPICVLTNGGIVNGIESMCDLKYQLFTLHAESSNLVLYCINIAHFNMLFRSLCSEELIAHLLQHVRHWSERFQDLQLFEYLQLLFEQQLSELERERLMRDDERDATQHSHRQPSHNPEALPRLIKDFICR